MERLVSATLCWTLSDSPWSSLQGRPGLLTALGTWVHRSFLQVYALLHSDSRRTKQHVDATGVQDAADSPKAHGSETNGTAVTGWKGAGHLSADGKRL